MYLIQHDFSRIYQILTGEIKKGMPQNSDIPFSFLFFFLLCYFFVSISSFMSMNCFLLS